tara:strand:- start:1030 stop:1380 length:351 start_codon:yes stop_codon:yes gene_type:complete
MLLRSVDERLELGVRRYGHGVRVNDDTTTWGTPSNSWIDMAREELLDAIIYIIADYIRLKGISSNRPDDNELIRSIANNWSTIDSPEHRLLLWNLTRMLDNKLFRNVVSGDDSVDT